MTHFSFGLIKSGGIPGNDAFTKILLHLNGANGGTSFPDVNVGGSAHTFAASGSAATSTAASKFGGSSLSIPGSGSFIYTGDSSDFTVGNGDWTIEGWINPNGSSGQRLVLGGQQPSDGNTTNTSLFLYRETSNKMVLQAYGPGITNTAVVGTSNVTGSSFVHVRGLRVGNVMRLFVNGVQEGGDTARTAAINDSTAQFRVGATEFTPSGASFYIQEFRLDVGIARDGGNAFTPPTAQYI